MLGLSPPPKKKDDAGPAASRRFLRRAHLMTKLPKRDQDALLRTIDTFLKLYKEQPDQ